jgi:predicted nucleotidyltransferase
MDTGYLHVTNEMCFFGFVSTFSCIIIYMEIIEFTETLKQKILDSVRQDPSIEHVILFGSFAYGNPTKDSDLDLIIIMDNKEKTRSYTEKWNRYIRVSRLLKNIRELPIDLLIYTSDEWNLLMTSDSSFLSEIKSKGITLQ